GRLRRQYRPDPRSGGSGASAGGRTMVDARAVDGGRRDASMAGPPPPMSSPDPARQPALRELLARRPRDPRHRGHEPAPIRVGTRLEPPIRAPHSHGAAGALPSA